MTSIKSFLVSLLLATAALAGAPALAVPTVITFDSGDPIGGLGEGAVLANQYAGYGVTFAPNAFTGPGVSGANWATNTNMSIANSSGGNVGGLGNPALVSGNLLHSFSGWLGEDGHPSFSAFFSTGINFFSADFAGVSVAANVRILAYQGATLLGTVVGATSGQFNLAFASSVLFDRIVILPGGFDDWVGVDNITFNQAALPPAGVPEPATMALLALGLAGVAFARRRHGK
ncbi:PEP-CTERM sorting domain-containing protein [Massilia sp. S19_KUP03_FR1]|uniref:PEP-CTERM sorting domain-containing protein n=1 Tax=Massilia sp. S19_KUP03_FR1 TaxID=3025503 RepID=UPI002FCCD20B